MTCFDGTSTPFCVTLPDMYRTDQITWHSNRFRCCLNFSPEKASLEDRGPLAGEEASSVQQGAAAAAGAAHGDPPAEEEGERVLRL